MGQLLQHQSNRHPVTLGELGQKMFAAVSNR